MEFLNELQFRNDSIRFDYRGVRLKKEYLTYSEWSELMQRCAKPAIKCEVKFLAKAAKMCLIPVLHGGPDPPID